MTKTDTKLKLICGYPIYVDGFGDVKPLKISDVLRIGYDEYNKHLGVLSSDVKNLEIYHSMNPETRDKINFLQLAFIISFEYNDNSILNSIIDSVEVITGEKVKNIDMENIRLITSNGFLGDNFVAFQEVIKEQNLLKSNNKNDEYKPANKKAAELIEKAKRNKQKVKQAKEAAGKSDEVDIADIVSALTVKSNSINKLNVLGLTIYQLYDEYKRLQLIDTYEFNVQAIMVGVKDIKLKHWSAKIQ